MAVSVPPRDPFRSPVAAAMRRQALRAAAAGPAEAGVGAPVLRLACVVAAGTYAFARWLVLIDGPPSGAGAAAAALAAATGAGLILAGRTHSAARRAAALGATLVAAAAGALLIAGAPLADLGPLRWGALSSGLGDGLDALPGLTVPYRGADAWARVILVLGGVLLLLLAAATAVWPRRTAPGSPVAGRRRPRRPRSGRAAPPPARGWRPSPRSASSTRSPPSS